MALKDESQLQDFVRCDLSQQPVSFFCRRCGVNLCDPCVPIHLRMKSKNGHDIVDYTSKDDDYTGQRDFHSHKFVVLSGCFSLVVLFLLLQNNCSAYCETCDAPICILCASIKHSSHEMSELSDKIEEPIKVIAKENVLLQSSKHELERILDHTTKLLSSISSTSKQRKDEVTAWGEEWHKHIEKTVNKLHQELDDMQKEHEVVLQKQKKEFEEIIEKVNEINEKIIKLQKTKNVREMHTSIPCIRKRKIMSEVSQYSIPKLYKRKIDELLENELTEKEFSCRRILDVPTVTSVIDTGFPADKKLKNRLYDMAVTDDNKVWMVGQSTELKLFDLQGHLHHTVSLTGIDSCLYLCIYNKKVVYTVQTSKDVRMVSDTDTVVTMFTTGDWKPYGVTSAASGDLLVCLRKDDQNKVVRYISTGTVLQEIQYDSQGQPLYKWTMYITENVNGDIIVTDWEKNAVIAVDRWGIFRYSYSGVTYSTVTTDSVGHVIVTDYFGDKIHMLDRDGRFLRYIIPEEGINRPRGVCILGDGEMMVGECLTGIAKRIKYQEE